MTLYDILSLPVVANSSGIFLSNNPAHARRLYTHARRLDGFHRLFFFDHPRKMFHHHSLTRAGFRAEVFERRFEPRLVRTHTQVHRASATIWQSRKQLSTFGFHTGRIGVDKWGQHNAHRTG